MACVILAPRAGIEPVPLALEARSLNQWTAREVPALFTVNGRFMMPIWCLIWVLHHGWSCSRYVLMILSIFSYAY